MFIFLIIGLLMGAMVIIFALQNIETVSVSFLTWQFDGSLALILVCAVAIGMIISSLLSIPTWLQRRREIRNLQKGKNIAEGELVAKKIEVEEEKSKLDATNAYLDDLENRPKV